MNAFRPFGRLPSPPDTRDWDLADFNPLSPMFRAAISYALHVTTGVLDQLPTVQIALPSRVYKVKRTLNQGRTNHCVAYAITHYGIAEPVCDDWDERVAEDLYYRAKVFDGDPGGEEGTCLRSGAKALQQLGRIGNYGFAHTLFDALAWLILRGPLPIGTKWYTGMDTPDSQGFVQPVGASEPDHATLWCGIIWPDTLVFQNSWDAAWGVNGQFKMHLGHFARLFADGGEALAAVELPLSV